MKEGNRCSKKIFVSIKPAASHMLQHQPTLFQLLPFKDAMHRLSNVNVTSAAAVANLRLSDIFFNANNHKTVPT